MHRDFPMPDLLIGHASDWLAAGPDREPANPPKPSATVMFLRPRQGDVQTESGLEADDELEADGGVADGDFEVFVLRRASTMAFAADMLAFPGGGVDARDADPGVPWAGPSPQEWASRLGVDETRARELVIAAAREVFEECGVLLAGPDADTVVADLTDPQWDRERDALLSREQSFAELLLRRALVLRSDLLELRAFWITPECEPKRYQTHFFVARLPQGQVADDRSTEAAMVRWATPRTLLAEADAGQLLMLPPTRVMIEQLDRADNLTEALVARQVWPVMPAPVQYDGQFWMRAPVDENGDGLPADETSNDGLPADETLTGETSMDDERQ